MKFRLVGIALVCCLLALVVALSFSGRSSAAPQLSAQSMSVTCSSDDGRLNRCDVDTRGGVQLTRQRSGSPCTFGYTWGYDERGIWVDRGCRADFQVGHAQWPGWGQAYTIYCASDDMGRQFCPTDTSGGVRLARQRSQADCIYGRTWGYSRQGVWVDRGCRADFQLGGSGWNGSSSYKRVTCSSDDMRRHYCKVDTRRGVQLIRQRSDADCVYGQTWGYDNRGIWVDRGCRADFQLGGWSQPGPPWGGPGGNQPYVVSVYCASDDMRRHTCSIAKNSGVRLVRKRSDADCIQGRTWGYDSRNIWVDRGCRADFEVSMGRPY